MFNKDKKPNEIRPAHQKTKDKSNVILNEENSNKPRDNKNIKESKTDMQSEGGGS